MIGYTQEDFIRFERNLSTQEAMNYYRAGQPQRGYLRLLEALHKQARLAGITTSPLNPVTGRLKGTGLR